MKKLFKVLAIIVLIIIALMIILPFVFEGKITEIAKKEINNSLNATVDFDDIDLSLIKNFPNFTLGIDGLTVVGKTEFENDTLASIENISVTIGLFSVIRGDNYEVKRIAVNSPKIKVKVLKNGRANYDISLPEKASESTTGEESGFNLQLKKLELNNGTIDYRDEEMDFNAYIDGFNLLLSGNFSADATLISTNLSAKNLTVDYEGVRYLSSVQLRYKANVDADLKNEIYTLGRNEMAMNNLLIGFNGSVSFVEEGINLVLTFDAPNNSFKSILSLVPAVYATDFENITATGDFAIDGSVKGIYNEKKLPTFNINLTVKDGMFQYPDLPKAVTNINVQSNITNPGGNADQTVIDISSFKLTMGNNPIKARLTIKTPVSDPDINAKINGELDLASVKDYYPLEKGNELSGVFVADITLNGKLSSIEKEQYDKFVALGSLLVKDLKYNTPSIEKPVSIPHAQLNFSPQYLDLVSLKMNIGESDFNTSGKIENYLAYTFGDGTLKGRLSTTSRYLNVDELLPDREKTEEEQDVSDEEQAQKNDDSNVLQIPDKIDFTMQSTFGKLIYDNLPLENVNGKLIIKDQTLKIQNLKSDIIGGKMKVNGNYSTADAQKPKINLDFTLDNIDIPTSYEKFAMIRKYLPLAKKTEGKFSSNLKLNSTLDQNMMPVYETMNGRGNLSTTKIAVKELNTLVEIANALYFDDLKNLDLDKISLAFQFVNGKLITKPFDIKYKNVTANLEGWTGLDQSIGYLMTMNIPREELGADANKLMDEITKEADKLGLDYKLPETIKVGISIGGTLSKPTVKTDLKQSGSDLVKQAKEELEKQIRKELQDQANKILAEADKQAKAIMDEANKQARYLRENADEAIANLNSETDKQVESLMTEAKKQGVLAEFAAKEAVKQLRKEADKQVQSLRNNADKQVNELLKTAKNQSNKIKQEARKKSDAILKK